MNPPWLRSSNFTLCLIVPPFAQFFQPCEKLHMLRSAFRTAEIMVSEHFFEVCYRLFEHHIKQLPPNDCA